MPPFIDLTGKRFGRLLVISREDPNKHGFVEWLCRCDCGTKKIISGNSLRHAMTHSCGCLRRESIVIHNGTGTPEFTIWQMMRQRCNNTNHHSYSSYGGRGITVCDRWDSSFENFLEDMGKRPSPTHTLDRKNNDGRYSPDNCKWSTPIEQGANKRTSHLIEFNGEVHTLSQWDKTLGFHKGTVGKRLRAGWSDVDAVTQPSSRVALSKRK